MRLKRFLYLLWYLKIMKLYLPSFSVWGTKTTVKNIWKYSKTWRFIKE